MAHAAMSRYIAPAILIVAAGTALTTLSNFSQAQSQPGTPSQTQPDQRDRQDRSRQDRDRNNQNQPSDHSNPNRDDSNRDGVNRDGTNRTDDRDGMTNDDDDFFWRDDRGNDRDSMNRNMYQAPFTFLSPQSETAFDERRQRLARMEERLTERTDEMIRQLGDIRQMEPTRRDEAMLDLMQQLLLDHRRLMLYLRQSRTAWSGDMTEMNNMNNTNNPNTPQRPSTTAPARPGSNGNR